MRLPVVRAQYGFQLSISSTPPECAIQLQLKTVNRLGQGVVHLGKSHLLHFHILNEREFV